ncbi:MULTISPECIES: methylglyoxal synthase [Clostridium]|uniref:Methylglyoxal synthase n=3 Tax=Clostridium TaxID=1485 RepID=A0A1J0GJ02_9CLOT|nr:MULTISPECIES: methylglyoxal synthase [Clostridium]APC41340.1 methylglyoxal synthase [Clostridium estertheticum subsp. estertheticum]MBU3072984.1 methylglyoxal synthase [Clostridium estertheticum]MBU3098434.1 methylglyoxal synthase [Clostridium sp. DSM 17811]MBU3153536.1 methylglyoxal synthase [Clostridium estertheticum]MBU3162979.1 methylglyoxal synthase [Clostridium estertheticum]
MRIALVAHDKKKEDMIDFAKRYKDILAKHELYGTGTTGKLINEEVGLPVTRFLSGPLGGDQQIGAKLAQGEMDMIIFLRDPLTPQPHEPDISALLRLCDVHCIPLATNLGTAEVLMRSLKDREY